MKVATAQIMQELDRETITTMGIPGLVLMENAGRGTVSSMFRAFENLSEMRVAILAGRGNNGGDGFVIGRTLLNMGVEVKVYLLSDPDRLEGDALTNFEIYEKLGAPLEKIPDMEAFESHREEISRFDLFVDAILGTGLRGKVRGFYKNVIDFLNQSTGPVVSVDIPSGLDSDTGKPLDACVRASLTTTLGLPKIGQLIYPGANYAGSLDVIDIGIPFSMIEAKSIPYNLIIPGMLRGLLEPRAPDSHKGHFGHLLVLAGSAGKTGAAAMTCEAAMRVGAGLVTLGIPSSLNSIMEIKLTEVMTAPLKETESQSLDEDCLEEMMDLSMGKDLLCIGPGLSTHPSTKRLVIGLLRNSSLPMVIDADGINAIVDDPGSLSDAKGPIALTPHPGEMARLLFCSVKEVQEDRIGKTRGLADKLGVHVVLKGARTIIAEPGGEIHINPTGNAGMAAAGVGDVLTGILSGLICQGLPFSDALCLGVYLHGHAADKLVKKRGERGLMATDLLEDLPGALQEINEGSGEGDGGPLYRP